MCTPSIHISMQILRISQVTLGKISVGHLVNLASNDVQRFDLVKVLFLFSLSICSLLMATFVRFLS